MLTSHARGTQVLCCSASDLVTGYANQSAIKTRDMFNKAVGGVLFIDEAYRWVRLLGGGGEGGVHSCGSGCGGEGGVHSCGCGRWGGSGAFS